jgi:hypothetical protein
LEVAEAIIKNAPFASVIKNGTVGDSLEADNMGNRILEAVGGPSTVQLSFAKMKSLKYR